MEDYIDSLQIYMEFTGDGNYVNHSDKILEEIKGFYKAIK
jgi:hypothetical protein